MKRIFNLARIIMVLTIGAAAAAVSGCTGSGNSAAANSDTQAQKSDKALQYTCSMHSEVVQDKPGDCPKCGMKLVEKR